MAVSISISITQNSQSVANNTSNVTVKVTANWTGGSHNAVVDASGTPQAKGWVKIDGVTYNFASKFNTGETQTGSQVICTEIVDVNHNDDGTKTLTCSASYSTGVSSGTVTAPASKVLTTIPRKSSLSASNGTLGTSQTLTVTRQAASFTHSIKAVCGSSTLYIKADGSTQTSEVKHSDCSIPFTPPLSWAAQNTTGTAVSVTFTITTYSGNDSVGSNTKTVSMVIPASVKPSVSIVVSDPKGHVTKYGAYVKGQSTLSIKVTASGNQGSTIKAYSTKADGKTYTGSTVTTSVLSGTGTLTISTTVTDSRGRTNTASTAVTVLSYSAPKISSLIAYRSNPDGETNDSGEYITVKFSASVTSLNNKNKATYSVSYNGITETLPPTALSVANSTHTFSADPATSYMITLSVKDDFGTKTQNTQCSSVSKLFSVFRKGAGLAFGKLAELADYLDVGWKAMFRKGLQIANEGFIYGTTPDGQEWPALQPQNENGNTVLGWGNYSNQQGNTNIYGNSVNLIANDGIYIDGRNNSVNLISNKGVFVHNCRLSANKVLWDGVYYMSETQTATLNEAISSQANGIILVWSAYDPDQKNEVNANFNMCFVPRYFVQNHPSSGVGLVLTTATLNVAASKYVYISDTSIRGYATNDDAAETKDTGIVSTPKNFVLRYVIGV